MRHLCGAVLLCAVAALGCGGSSGGGGKSLDCALLAGDNCWKATASLAASCLPASSEIGTLSADGKSCTYASGALVTFATPVVLPIPTNGDQSWNFTVTGADGQPCLAYKDDQSGITLTTQGQTVRQTAPGGLSVALVCPDGTTYSNSNAFNLFSCPDAGLFGGLPGDVWSSTDTSVSLGLLATSSGAYGSLSVFNCQKPL